ncbi:hypothetical protein [Paraburkholderia terricola]|uniref:hypothetical protein n=1 Tax=Paraburkholderia terricola TaxID=169427 RepID=UPI00286C5B8A|nr:hypothetical protein [Paraburkholderia terricola]
MGFRQVFGHESHWVDALSRTKHWVLGAVIAALCSFAYAKAPGMLHGGGGGGYASGGAAHVMRGDARNDSRYYGAPNARPARNDTADRNMRLPRGGADLAGGIYANGFGNYEPRMRRVAGPSGPAYPGVGRGGIQYAGAIKPVSAESRSAQRPPGNGPVRSGSIRADVARYNEERGSTRAMPRQSDDPRQQEGSPYRN